MDGALGRWTAELGTVHALTVSSIVTASLTIRNNCTIRATSLGSRDLLSKLLSDLVGIVLVDTGGKQQVLSPLDIGGMIVILTRVGGFVFENLDELIEAGRDDGTKDWSNPVDPMVTMEGAVDNRRTEGTSRVEGTTGEVDSSQLGDEQCKTNT